MNYNPNEPSDSCLLYTSGLTDASGLERECDHLQAEQDAVAQQIGRMIRENAEVAQNQAEYNARLQPLEDRYEALKNAMLKTKEAISCLLYTSRCV